MKRIQDSATEMCINNGFFVKLKVLSVGIGCTAEFPANIFVKPNVKPLSITYLIDIVKNIVEIYPLNDGGSVKTISTKRYLIRPLIILSIMLEAKKRLISKDLILLFKDQQYYKFEEVLSELQIELNKEEQSLECTTLMMVPILLNGDFSKLESNEDNEFLCEFLQNGGF